jgi:riboflavin biosynthesis pyrimidine reductase
MACMPLQKLPDSVTVTQVFPDRKQVPLAGLYLGERLADLSVKIGRSLVVTDFLTDRNGIIAKADERHNFMVPSELRNSSDWQLFQELMAQADVIISGEAYLKRISTLGSHAQNIFSQFEPGRAFEKLGDWRLSAAYKRRSPDLAIVSRNLDFNFPEGVLRSGRRIVVFTTYSQAGSKKATALIDAGGIVVGSGETGVEGKRMIDFLSKEMDYRVIMMATGPSVLQLLLEAKRLDIFYVTEAQLEIPFDDPSMVQTILPEGRKVYELVEFRVIHRYLQENGIAENGSHIAQEFLRYDRKGALDGGRFSV